MPLPGFLVIGAPKAGTTALHVALARHPQLYLSKLKEPKYFLCDEGVAPHYVGPGDARTARAMVCRREDYEALFAAAPPGALCGESTSLYLQDPAAHRRIAAMLPGVRLIALLRDPLDRAHSNWSHLWSAGLEPERDFVAACAREEQRAAAGWAPFWRYLGLGRYGEQLSALYQVVPRDRVLLVRYRVLRNEPLATLDRICRFLDVEPGVLTEIPAENVTVQAADSAAHRVASGVLRAVGAAEHRLPQPWWRAIDGWLGRHLQREQRRREPLRPEQREALLPRIADDVHRLEDLTGESFADWLDPHRPDGRADLRPRGPIGTAYGSIDRPLESERQ
jgi:hypothetical protein